jgi:hypothetical protein
MKMLRDSIDGVTERKALGLGFKDLLEGAKADVGLYNFEGAARQIQFFFSLAVKSEDENNVIDALFYYRYIIEIFNERIKNNIEPSEFDNLNIVLKAMNNIGGICYDLDQKNEALTWFKRILMIDSDNIIAKENLEVLNREL